MSSAQGAVAGPATEHTRLYHHCECTVQKNNILAQTCYRNSIVQALLTLGPFIQEVSSQEENGSSSAIIRLLSELSACRVNNNKAERRRTLAAFKKAIANFCSEFNDHNQKDAHEFLDSVLKMSRSVSLDLQGAAQHVGWMYTCPLITHITFQMMNTITCDLCGFQSNRVENYTSLSLGLVSGGSVTECLEEYLKENRYPYLCHCGGWTLSRRYSFLTLPNVLTLHLKRIQFKNNSLKMVKSPVILSRELMVFNSILKERACYSLMSIVSHLGSTVNSVSGHYMCDGANQGTTDRWVNYSRHIREMTAALACYGQQREAYLLTYEKQRVCGRQP